MSEPLNRQVVLAARPNGIPQAHDFEIVTRPMPMPGDGEVRVRNLFLSVEPAMRGWVSSVGNYSEPVAIGAVMRALTVGQIEASNLPGMAVGEYVTGMFGWQEYALANAQTIDRRVPPPGLPIATALGILGINGNAAYFGLLDIGQPKAGETVVVSTAAGAVGACVGQIANLQGCRTVGIAGGAVKTRLCTEIFGYAAAIDYKTADLDTALRAACPSGIDVYFDNTAGPITDAVLRHLNPRARVVICGTAAVASWDPPPLGPRIERHFLVKRARMEGFVVFDYKTRYPEALAALTQWVSAGQIRYREDILHGLEAAPDAIAGLYRGENLGKRLIQLGA